MDLTQYLTVENALLVVFLFGFVLGVFLDALSELIGTVRQYILHKLKDK